MLLLNVIHLFILLAIVSEVLGLADDSGYNKIKGYVTNDVIKSCRLGN